jgi:hypothetical protein
MTGFFFCAGLEPTLHSDTSLKLPTGQFINGWFGSSPCWGAKQANHLHGFRVSGFFFGASFGPGFGGNFYKLRG